MRNIIITGCTGAVGMALINKYLGTGDRVFAVLRPGSARNERLSEHENLIKVFCDMTELKDLPEKISEASRNASLDVSSYFAMFHFAWAGTTGAARNDMGLQTQNIKCALDAVTAAAKLGCEVFIGAGSQAEYGRVEGVLTPDTPCNPENGYGMAKLCAGYMTRKMASDLGIRHIWPRILSVYGPYDGAQSMVMSAVSGFISGESPAFTAGEQKWDYLYSGDAAEIMAALADRGTDGKVYCLGSGEVRPLAEYIRDIKDICAPDAELNLGAIPYAPLQVMYLQADVSDIENDLGLIRGEDFGTDFADGIKKTVCWYKSGDK